jgi:carboxymethylenebutenolidase
MLKGISLIIFLTVCLVQYSHTQNTNGPDTVTIHSGKLKLKGLLWFPAGRGPFPTIIFCHGSYSGTDTMHDPVENISVLGPIFARKGYVFLGLFRRGVGLSNGQGVNSIDLMDKAFKKYGLEERNKVQLQQLEKDQLQDMMAGLAYLRKRWDVDKQRMAIIGHSFGGSLTLLVAELDPYLKAVVVFGPAAASWDYSPQLRTRLISAVENIKAPTMFIHAQNDYSTNPGFTLDSVMNHLGKPHILKIYPKFGNSASEGHNVIFQDTKIWETDVFKFLKDNLRS